YIIMKTYKQMYEQAQKDESLKQLTPEYMEWKKPDQQVIGAFISKGLVSSSAGGGDYYQYVFGTDTGNVKFHMGKASDNDIGAVLVPGVVYCITYLGKEEISGGRSVNKFNVEEIGPVGEFAAPAAEAK
ncbi:unnamed protein product, partial [marine sediment metagenome]